MRNILAISCAIVCCNQPALAQSAPYSKEYSSCMVGAGGDADKIDACASRELSQEDNNLNIIYRNIMSQINPNRREYFLNSERAWMRYRDAECNFRGSLDMSGGGLGVELRLKSETQQDCLLELTRNRLEMLKHTLGFYL